MSDNVSGRLHDRLTERNSKFVLHEAANKRTGKLEDSGGWLAITTRPKLSSFNSILVVPMVPFLQRIHSSSSHEFASICIREMTRDRERDFDESDRLDLSSIHIHALLSRF